MAPSTSAPATPLEPQADKKIVGVGGFTYNFKNPDTQYQSGIDFHFDWGVSQFLSKQVFVGLVGYAYQQIPTTLANRPFSAASARASSASALRSDIFFRLGAVRHFWA